MNKPTGTYKCLACGSEMDGSELLADPHPLSNWWVCKDPFCGGTVIEAETIAEHFNELPEWVQALWELAPKFAREVENLLQEYNKALTSLGLHKATLGAAMDMIDSLQQEIEADNKIIAERQRLLDAIPECPEHGCTCVPHAIEWVEGAIDKIKQLEEELTVAQDAFAWVEAHVTSIFVGFGSEKPMTVDWIDHNGEDREGRSGSLLEFVQEQLREDKNG